MMILRKDRVHLTGTSNLTNSSSKHHIQLGNPFLNASLESSPIPSPTKSLNASPSKLSNMSPSRVANVHDVVLKKHARSLISPQQDTAKTYEELNKTKKDKAIVSSARTSNLEEVGRSKLVFTGESFLEYDRKLDKYRKGDESPVKSKPKLIMASPTIRTKQTENAQAIQETQLVGGGKFKSETLKNNVNLEKVREARRALRRKYANRKNLQKIFAAWDEENKGFVSIENVFSMGKKLGLNLNYDEARVLLASADQDGSGSLGLDKFLDLIYNKDDALNVNLDIIAEKYGDEYTIKKEALEKGDDNLFKNLNEDARKAREAKHMNQLKLILKNKLPDLNLALLDIDPDKTGYVNLFKFEQAVQKLRISELVLPQKDIKEVFDKHKSDHLKLNYREFLENLRDFKFEYDKEYLDYSTPKQKKPKRHVNVVDRRSEQDEEPLRVVDCRTLPYNMIVNFHTRSKKVGKAIQRFFPDKDQFNDYLSQKMEIPKEKIENHYISKDKFKELTEDLFRKFDVNGLQKRDIEGFLSSILYNKQDQTTFKEIAYTIYDESEKQFFDKVQRQKKGPVPNPEIALLDSAPASINNSPSKTNDYGFGNEADPNNTGTEKSKEGYLKIDTESHPRSSNSLPFIQTSGFATMKNYNSKRDKRLDSDIKKILMEIDGKVFRGKKTALKAFREFDVDGDGYVSHKDLAARIEDQNIVGKEEVEKLLSYMDPEKKGYVDFIEFSQKIRPNAAFDDEFGQTREAKAKTSLFFTKPEFRSLSQSAVLHRKTMQEIKKSLAGDSTYDMTEKVWPTRFSGHPGWHNSFMNFQANSHSSMFVTDEERFDRHRLAATKFQKEEKEKSQAIQEARAQVRRDNEKAFRENMEREAKKLEARDQANISLRTQNLLVYEQNARLRNAYA